MNTALRASIKGRIPMKKLILKLPLYILIAGLLCQCSAIHNRREEYLQEIRKKDPYFCELNKIIKDFKFDTAKAENGKIVLYNEKNEPIFEIPFEEYDESIEFLYAYKKGKNVYFVTHKEADEETGVMLVNDGSEDMMSGLWSAEHINGNAYEYDTMIKY